MPGDARNALISGDRLNVGLITQRNDRDVLEPSRRSGGHDVRQQSREVDAGRPPRLDLTNWPHLPAANVQSTQAADYLALLGGSAKAPQLANPEATR